MEMKGSKSTSGFRKFVFKMSRWPPLVGVSCAYWDPSVQGRGPKERWENRSSSSRGNARSLGLRQTADGCVSGQLSAPSSENLAFMAKVPGSQAQSPSTEYSRGTEELVYKRHNRGHKQATEVGSRFLTTLSQALVPYLILLLSPSSLHL